jgi:hypothetical protein
MANLSRTILEDFKLVYDFLPVIYRRIVPFERIMKCIRAGESEIVLDCLGEFCDDIIVTESESDAIRHFTNFLTDRTYLLLLMNT